MKKNFRGGGGREGEGSVKFIAICMGVMESTVGGVQCGRMRRTQPSR